MPDGSPRLPYKSTFDTLAREKRFKHPPKNSHAVPILNEFVTPHLESFNALFDDSGLPRGDGDGKGLLALGLKDIGERVVFDGKGELGSESGQRGWGNRLTSALVYLILQNTFQSMPIKFGMSRSLSHDLWFLSGTRVPDSGKCSRPR